MFTSSSTSSVVRVKYCNARSLKNKLLNLYDLLYNENFQIVCFTETWLCNNVPDGLLDPRGVFNIFRHDRNSKHVGGGVCIFIKRSLSVSNINIIDDFTEVEIVAVNISLVGIKKITVICCYLAPSLSTINFTSAINCLEFVIKVTYYRSW